MPTAPHRILTTLNNLLMVAAICAFTAIALVPNLAIHRATTAANAAMSPTIPPGALMLTSRMPVALVTPGQVITYQPHATHDLVTERVTAVERRGSRLLLHTRADASTTALAHVVQFDADDDVAYPQHVIPHVGAAVSSVRHAAPHSVHGLLLLLSAVPSLLTICFRLMRLRYQLHVGSYARVA